MAHLSPVNQARWARFRHNRRGFWSLWIFLVLFGLSLCSELIANDKPLLVRYDGSWYFPLVKNYSESDFGGPLATRADYRDPWLKQQLEDRGWVLWAPVRFGANSINFATDTPFPRPFGAKLAGYRCQRWRRAGSSALRHTYLHSFRPDANPVFKRDGRAGRGVAGLLRWQSDPGASVLSRSGRACRRCS